MAVCGGSARVKDDKDDKDGAGDECEWERGEEHRRDATVLTYGRRRGLEAPRGGPARCPRERLRVAASPDAASTYADDSRSGDARWPTDARGGPPPSPSSSLPPPAADANGDSRVQRLSPLSSQTPAATAKKRRKLVQLHLDCGQRALGARPCGQCGFLYTVGVSEDESEHRRHHDEWQNGVRIGSSALGKRGSGRRGGSADDGVHELTGDAGASWVRRLFRLARRELNASDDDGYEDDADGGEQDGARRRSLAAPRLPSKSMSPSPSAQQQRHRVANCACDALCKVFILVRARRAIGLLVARPKRSARDRTPHCGVDMIWVHRHHRRCGVATRMLDTARCAVWAGATVPRARCAFTELTSSGRAFAEVFVHARAARVDGAREDAGVGVGVDAVAGRRRRRERRHVMMYRSDVAAEIDLADE